MAWIIRDGRNGRESGPYDGSDGAGQAAAQLNAFVLRNEAPLIYAITVATGGTINGPFRAVEVPAGHRLR